MSVRALAWMLTIVGLLTFAGVYARLVYLLLEKPGANDFTIFYYTARMVSEGLPMYGDLPRSYGVDWKGAYLGNLNPPHFQLIVAPLVPLGYRGALVAWVLLNAAVSGDDRDCCLQIPFDPRKIFDLAVGKYQDGWRPAIHDSIPCFHSDAFGRDVSASSESLPARKICFARFDPAAVM